MPPYLQAARFQRPPVASAWPCRYPWCAPEGQSERECMDMNPPTNAAPRMRPLLVAALLASGLILQGVSKPAPASQARASSAQRSSPASSSFSADLPGSTQWKDTGVDVKPGDSIEITASGKLQYADAQQSTGPE